MLMTAIWLGMVGLATILMAADWYLWGPRYRASEEYPPDAARNHAGLAGYPVRLPKAA